MGGQAMEAAAREAAGAATGPSMSRAGALGLTAAGGAAALGGGLALGAGAGNAAQNMPAFLSNLGSS